MSDRKIEAVKEKLKLYTELLRNLVIFLIAVGGGCAGLLFKLSNPVSIPLLIVGLILAVATIFSIIKVGINLREIVKELEKWEKKS